MLLARHLPSRGAVERRTAMKGAVNIAWYNCVSGGRVPLFCLLILLVVRTGFVRKYTEGLYIIFCSIALSKFLSILDTY